MNCDNCLNRNNCPRGIKPDTVFTDAPCIFEQKEIDALNAYQIVSSANFDHINPRDFTNKSIIINCDKITLCQGTIAIEFDDDKLKEYPVLMINGKKYKLEEE